MFPAFETMFWITFILSLIFTVFFFVVLIIRIIKAGSKIQEQTTSETQPIIKEREIIREIVKIRCPTAATFTMKSWINALIEAAKNLDSKF